MIELLDEHPKLLPLFIWYWMITFGMGLYFGWQIGKIKELSKGALDELRKRIRKQRGGSA